MRPQRNKQLDWSKSFKLIESKKDFQEIQTGEDLNCFIDSNNRQIQAQQQGLKKQNIITPRIQTVQRITSIKPFAKINPNYIRLSQRLILPKLIDYQLTEDEFFFVQTHAQRYKFKQKIILTHQFLSKAFIELQLKAGKSMTLRRSKFWMDQYLDRDFQQLRQWEHFDDFSALVYNFWKNRREELKFPLLRPLWRPNPGQFNHLLAFKPRQKDKRNLRKTTRISEDFILEELTEEFYIAKEITDRVQMREQLRLRSFQVQIALFHNQCKTIFGTPDFIRENAHENWLKDKEKIKNFHQKLDKIKLRKLEPLEPELETVSQQQIYNQKTSIANFLANIAVEAELFNISYSKIFQSKSQSFPNPVLSVENLPAEEQSKIREALFNIHLSKTEKYLFRDFNCIQSQSLSQSLEQNEEKEEKKVYDCVFDYKKSKVCSFYFGEDDEGDGKDFKKNLILSFKKFQNQSKQY